MIESNIPKRRGRGPQHHVRSAEAKIAKSRAKYEAEQKHKLESASARQADAHLRTPSEQLARLNKRLGAGSGATRERERLAARIAAQGGAQAIVEVSWRLWRRCRR